MEGGLIPYNACNFLSHRAEMIYTCNSQQISEQRWAAKRRAYQVLCDAACLLSTYNQQASVMERDGCRERGLAVFFSVTASMVCNSRQGK